MSGYSIRIIEYSSDERVVSIDDIPYFKLRRCGDELWVCTGTQVQPEIFYGRPESGGHFRCFIMNDRGDSTDQFSIGAQPSMVKADRDIPGGRSVLLEDCPAPLIIQHVEIEGGRVRRRLRLPDGGLMTIADCQRLATELLADIALA